MPAARRIILTRQHKRNREWAVALRLADIPVLELPLIRFVPLPVPTGLDPGSFDWILFTSPQAVRAFREAGLDRGNARVGSLGSGTAAALTGAGLPVDFDPGCHDGAEFAAAFAAAHQAPARLLWPGPEKRMDAPLRVLTEAGFDVTEAALYRTEPVPREELPADPWLPGDVLFFCSPSAVRAFAAAYAVRPACVAIGETTAAAAREAGFTPRTASAPDLASMVRAAGLDIDPVTPSPEKLS